MTSEMKEYCRNNECRRNVLLKDFDDNSTETETLGCQCCDVCSVQCYYNVLIDYMIIVNMLTKDLTSNQFLILFAHPKL